MIYMHQHPDSIEIFLCVVAIVIIFAIPSAIQYLKEITIRSDL